MKVAGEIHYLRRAADQDGEVLESLVSKRRERKRDLKLLKKSMQRSGSLQVVVTDNLTSYGTAMKVIGNATFSDEAISS